MCGNTAPSVRTPLFLFILFIVLAKKKKKKINLKMPTAAHDCVCMCVFLQCVHICIIFCNELRAVAAAVDIATHSFNYVCKCHHFNCIFIIFMYVCVCVQQLLI